MQVELNATQVDYLRCALEEELERNRDHIDWLQSEEASDEEDKPQQIAECEQAIEQASTLLDLLGGARGERFSWPLRTLAVGAEFLVPPHIDERTVRQYVSDRGRALGRKFAVTKTSHGLKVTRTT